MQLIVAIWRRKLVLMILLALAIGVLAWRGWYNGDEQKIRYKTQVVDVGDVRQVSTANGTLNPVVLERG